MSAVGERDGLRQWQHAGLDCKILVSPMGSSLNGYVRLPDDHPDYDKGYDDIAVDVSGGLTHGADDAGWVGFDTAHSGDVWTEDALADAGVQISARARDFMQSWNRHSAEPWAMHWTLDRMVAEVERLAEQLAAISLHSAQGADF